MTTAADRPTLREEVSINQGQPPAPEREFPPEMACEQQAAACILLQAALDHEKVAAVYRADAERRLKDRLALTTVGEVEEFITATEGEQAWGSLDG